MTEYWKSYEKKYCEVCKCWIADNKISVSIHEGGKKHKENVKSKINNLVKKTCKEIKNQRKLDSEMQKMEDEAMKAYLKDIEDNPDMSSNTHREKVLPTNNERLEVPLKKKLQNPGLPKDERPKPSYNWYEAKSEEGLTYYWNTVSNETAWDAPSDGFFSLKQQKAIASVQAEETKTEINAAIERSKMQIKYREKIEHNLFEKKEARESAASFREQVKSGTASIGPTKNANGPYGVWTTITATEQSHPVLDIPDHVEEEQVPILKRERIKEKTWDQVSLGPPCKTDPVQFKKRKFGGNVRRRLDDDDDDE